MKGEKMELGLSHSQISLHGQIFFPLSLNIFHDQINVIIYPFLKNVLIKVIQDIS